VFNPLTANTSEHGTFVNTARESQAFDLEFIMPSGLAAARAVPRVFFFSTPVLREDDVWYVREEMAEFLEDSLAPVLWLDMAEVELPTAAGLSGLLALHKELRAFGRELVLCNVSERVYEVFEVVRLTEVLDLRREGAQEAA